MNIKIYLRFDFTIELNQGRKTVDKKISFTIYKPGVSSFISNIDIAIRQMKYAITNKERNQLITNHMYRIVSMGLR